MITTCHASGEVLGQMRLVQAIALRWLGHYPDAERCALEAHAALPQGSTGWYAALGHARAKSVLREALSVGEPMKLSSGKSPTSE